MSRLTRLSRSVAGRRVVITGAGSGMGRATAHLFADEGATVCILDNSDSILSTRDEIASVHGESVVDAVVVDVTDERAVRDAIDAFGSVTGVVDALINNAGISLPSPLGFDDDSFDEAWNRTLAINLSAYVRTIRATLPYLRASDAGRIVNIASTEAIVATPGISAYSASKAGVTGLTRSLAVELGPTGITVNCICPGPINTGMTAGIPDEAKDKYARRRVALRRYADPEEVAHMTLSLCLPAMSFTTGASIPVDGGVTVRHT
jgi:3-oxoacyl-[acyl-carrier protein] reductase